MAAAALSMDEFVWVVVLPLYLYFSISNGGILGVGGL